MSRAIRLQQRRGASRTRRLLAIVIGLWFVACGALGTRHEAEVAHVVDRATGQVRHAEQMIGEHTNTTQSDVHGETENGDHGVCSLSTALHQAVRAPQARLVADSPETTFVCVRGGVLSTLAVTLVYRLAPKTSPPTIV
jgi:hypothetical protein